MGPWTARSFVNSKGLQCSAEPLKLGRPLISPSQHSSQCARVFRLSYSQHGQPLPLLESFVPQDSSSVARAPGIKAADSRVVQPDHIQSTLSKILSTDSIDDDHDPLEEMSLEHKQAAASVGRAVYEVLRIDKAGKGRRIYVKRRDLLRANGLQPRDLRRIDPSLSLTKTSPNITVKENALLVNLGGVRAILMAEKCLLFEPNTVSSRKFLQIVAPRLAASADQRKRRKRQSPEVQGFNMEDPLEPPFELECLEGAFMVATGRLEAEMEAVTKRMAAVLQKLPSNITPVNLEELRRVKQQLVELESRADQLRDMVEEIMDDEDEVRELNLSSRPIREERRRFRERERLERGMARTQQQSESTSDAGSRPGRNSWSNGGGPGADSGGIASSPRISAYRRDPDGARNYEEEDEGYQEAEAALEEMEEAEEEEREVEEVEDVLEYYLQRAAATQSEAERLLDGARDLEESIGVSLSARRFEVNRLELTLSIGSFAAGLGAMIAGIFGMNLTSTWEASIVGFWGITGLIVLGCIWIVFALYTYTRRRKIL